MKRHKRYPYLMNMHGRPAVVKEALVDALQAIWKDIPEPLLESLYASLCSWRRVGIQSTRSALFPMRDFLPAVLVNV